MKNGPANHMAHMDHRIDWDSTSIIDLDRDYWQRKVKESLYIHAMNPGQVVTSLMNLEKGDKKIDSCWNQFLPDIRSRVLKKGRALKRC